MADQNVVALLEIARTKFGEFVDGAIAAMSGSAAPLAGESAPPDEAGEPTAPSDVPEGSGTVWKLEGSLPEGGFQEVGHKTGETYTWGDGNTDEYDDFIVFRGTGGFDGTQFALGLNTQGDVVGFFLGSGGGSKRGITYFFPADDFAKSYEMLSMIRGGGSTGKAGFGPADVLPEAYSSFNVDILRGRIHGKWNRQAVVADKGDYPTMLSHTFLQAKLRGLL